MLRTLKARIVLGISGIVALGGLLALVAYAGFSDVQKTLHRLADVEEPSAAAAYEMEINILGMAVGVLSHWEDRAPQARARVIDDEADFERFHTRFLVLAATSEEIELGRKVDLAYREFRNLAHSLMDKRDERAVFFGHARSTFREVDAALETARAQRPALRSSLSALEAGLAAASGHLSYYERVGGGENLQQFAAALADCLRSAAALRALPGTDPATARVLARIDEALTSTGGALARVLLQREEARVERRRFLDLREEIDALLDEEIQVLTRMGVEDPRKRADEKAAAVLRRARYLTLAFVVAATALGFLLVRSIDRRVAALLAGTRAITAGDLQHRVALTGEDELADLGRQFDEMVRKLEATTVSRNELEVSEARLKAAVTELQAVAADRLQAQQALRLSEERLRALSGRVIAAQEAERVALARDLHDEVGQCLTAVRITLLRAADEAARARTPELLAEAIGVLEATMTRVRGLTMRLRPPMLDDLGLVAAIRWLLDSQIARAGIRYKLDVRFEPSAAPPALASVAFRVVQEALTNVLRHARARAVRVTIPEDAGNLIVIVRDDGAGFDLPSVRSTASAGGCLGLVGMEERARLLGGEVKISSAAQQGTEVRLRLPLLRDAAHSESAATVPA